MSSSPSDTAHSVGGVSAAPPAAATSHYTIRLRPRKTLLEPVTEGSTKPVATTTTPGTTPTATSTGGKRPRSQHTGTSSSAASAAAASTATFATAVAAGLNEDADEIAARLHEAANAAGSAASQQELFKVVETTAPWAAAASFLNTVLEAYMPLGDTPTMAVDPSSLSATMAGCEQVCTYVRALTDSGYAPVLYTHVVAKLRLHAAAAVARLGTQAKATITNNKNGSSALSLHETVQRLCAEAGKELCDIVDRNTIPETGASPTTSKKQASSSSSTLEMFIASEVKRVNKELNVSSTAAATSEAAIANQQQAADAPSSAAEILVAASPEIALLRAAVRLWDRWASVLTIVSDVFMYLGRRYVLLETTEGSIMQLGVKLLEQELNSAHAKTTVFESANSAFACLLVSDQTMATSLVMGGPASTSMEVKSVALQIGAWCFANDQKRVLGYRTRGGIRSPNAGGFGTSTAPHFSTLRTLVSELLSYRDLTTSVNYYVSSLHPQVVESLTQMYDSYSAWLVSEASPAEALLSIAGIPSRTFNHSNNTNNSHNVVTHRSLASNNNSANTSSRVSPTTTGPNAVLSASGAHTTAGGGSSTVLEMLSQLMTPDALTPATTASNNNNNTTAIPSSSGAASAAVATATTVAPHTPATIVEAIRVRCSSNSSTTSATTVSSHTINASVFFHCAHHLVYRERRRAVVFLNNSCSSVSGSSEMVEELVQQHAIKPFVGILFQRDFRDLVVEGIALETHHRGVLASSSATSYSATTRVPTGLDAVALGFHLLCMRYVRQKDVAKETFHTFIETISGWYMQAASLLGDEAGGGGSGLPSSNSSEAVAVQLSIMENFAAVLGTSILGTSGGATAAPLLETIDEIESTYLSSELQASKTPSFKTSTILKSVTLKKVSYLKSYTRLVRQQSLLVIAKDAVERQFPSTPAGTANTSVTSEKSDKIAPQSRFASVIAAIAFRRHLRTFVSVLPTSEVAETAPEDEPCTSEKLFASWLARMGVACSPSATGSSVDFGGLVQGERGWGCGGGIHPSPLIELPTLIPEHLITNLVALRQACDSIVRRCFLGEAATPPNPPLAESTVDDSSAPVVTTTTTLADVVTNFSTAVFSETAKAAASRAAAKAGGAKGGLHHHHGTHSHHTPNQQVTAGFYAAEFTRAIRVGFERGFNKFAPCDDDDSSDDDDDKDKATAGGETTSTMETAFGLVGSSTAPILAKSSSSSSLAAASDISKYATKLERFHTYLQYQRPLELRGEVVPELLAQHIDTLMRTLRTSVSSHLVALSAPTTTTAPMASLETSQTQFMNSLIDVSGLEVRDRVQASLIKSSHGAVTCAKKDIDRALTLFDYLPSKDVFEALYVRDFSKRALGFVQECVLRMSENAAAAAAVTSASSTTTTTPSSPSTGVDVSSFVSLERHAIRQLRLVCGTSLTSKLEGMLKDLTDGFGKINDAYLEYKNNSIIAKKPITTTTTSEQEDGSDVRTTTAQHTSSSSSSSPISPAAGTAAGVFFVLSQSFWPFADTFKPNPAALPPAISKELEAFTAFFSTHRKSCALRWVPTLSECVVGFKAHTTNAPLDLHMSLLQGLILTSCFNSDIDKKNSTTSNSNNNNKIVTIDEIVRTVCEMEAAPPADESSTASSLALPVASSVGITVSSSGATLAKVESRRALARSKTLTREQQAVLANVQCALVSLAAPEVGILTPIFAQTPLGANNTTLYPLLGGMIQGFAFNPSAAVLDPITPNQQQQQLSHSRNVPQLVVSNLGTSAYASAASSQPLSGSHAVVRQHMLARATSSALEKQQQNNNNNDNATTSEVLSVEQISDLKWTACLKYLNAELLHCASHPATSLSLLPTSTAAAALSPIKKGGGASATSPPPSALHTQITMRLVSALGDFMDDDTDKSTQHKHKDAESDENMTSTTTTKTMGTLFDEISTFVPVFLSEAELEMAGTMLELDAPNQRVRFAVHTTSASTLNSSASAPTFKMMMTPAFAKVYPHLVKHVIASTTSGGLAGSNASPHRDSSSRVAKSVAMQRPYIIDVAVVQVLKNVGKLPFQDLLAQVHSSPAVANKFEVAAPLLKNRLTQLKARGVIALSGGGDDGNDVATMVIEYKA